MVSADLDCGVFLEDFDRLLHHSPVLGGVELCRPGAGQVPPLNRRG